MQDTIELSFEIPAGLHERLIAELDALGCEGFVEEDETLKAYLPSSQWGKEKAEVLLKWLQQHQMKTGWQEKLVEMQDWNAQWERSIQPIVAPPFYIRPSWADPPDDSHPWIDIVIDPKMSFGTGHHESTRLILSYLSETLKPGDKILDAGAGTAILSIAAAKLGAASVTAFDIDSWACQNAQENIGKNRVDETIRIVQGDLETIRDPKFDVILANINRHVLLEYMSGFVGRLRPGGVMLLAGLLVTDRELMIDAATSHKFVLIEEASEGEWWSAKFEKVILPEEHSA